MRISQNHKSLYKNTIMLYVLTFSSFALNFIVIPYETRVLGANQFGILGLGMALMIYFQLFIDFGFMLSATQEVAKSRDNTVVLSTIFSSITVAKLLLIAVSIFVLYILCSVIEQWKDYYYFFLLFLIATSINSLLPDYLYRGIEKMETITIRTVCTRVIFAALLFVVVKKPSDYIWVPALQIIGNLIALLFVYFHLYRSLNIKFIACKPRDILCMFKVSLVFFISRIATTIYSAANTIILDIVFRGTMTAYYTTAEKFVSFAKQGVTPISDSLYPYMIKNKDFKLIKKIILIFEPLVIITCIAIYIFAKPICVLYFGQEYSESAMALRALLPIIVVILPSYILGFPALSAMGLSKHANYSVIIGSVLHASILIALFKLDNVNIVTLSLLSSFTEIIIMAYRIVIIYKNRMLPIQQ